jgi:hypothetical protein
MALADYKPPRAAIKCGDEDDAVSFEVRALSLSDLGAIIRIHRDATEEMVAELTRHAETGASTEATIQLLMTLIADAPAVMATVIAFAADEPLATDRARELPLNVSVEALNKIGELTFTDIAALKKTIASARQLLTGVVPAEMLPAASAA